MENFVWSMQIVSPLVYLAATAAFLCLSLSAQHATCSHVSVTDFTARALCAVTGENQH
jgi:hypothetical protein